MIQTFTSEAAESQLLGHLTATWSVAAGQLQNRAVDGFGSDPQNLPASRCQTCFRVSLSVTCFMNRLSVNE